MGKDGVTDVYKRQVYNLLIQSPETKRLGNILNRLVHGSAKTFNQPTNVDLSNPYTVLDISELTGDLLVVGMFVALDYVWDKAKEDRTKEKAIFIDEIWQLIGASSNTMAAEFCLEIFKIIRGYGGAAIAATQDLTDFFAPVSYTHLDVYKRQGFVDLPGTFLTVLMQVLIVQRGRPQVRRS